tara:strand:- start:10738 stop:11757 length:1020 start_codon:yes stop_codon:yes gene_type:complete
MKIVRFLLFPFGIIYYLFSFFRNLLFDLKILKSKYYKVPNIAVGNLSMGGTGKSVLIIYLVELFQSKYNTAILSRGYKRKSKGFFIANGDSSAQLIGDEPYQFYKRFPEITVAVSENRSEGINKILKDYPSTQLILFDDILQHRSINAHLRILTTTFNSPFFRDYIFPVGNLREARAGHKRVDIILVTKCPKELNESDRDNFSKGIKLQSYQKIFFTKISYSLNIYSRNKKIDLLSLQSSEFILVTGIADSSYLIDYLNSKNLKFIHIKYSDHYNYTNSDIKHINSKAKNKIVLTTEKDYWRLNPLVKEFSLYFLPIKMSFFSNEEKNSFNNHLKKLLN